MSSMLKAKNKFQRILMLLIFTGFTMPGYSQNIPFLDSVSVYGNLCGQLAFYKETLEVQNNGSRIGLYLDYSFKNEFKILGHTEWAVNLVENNYSFNASAITDENIPDAIFDQSKSAFNTRLGYLGVDFNKFGTLTIGKQWSAYYDVSGWTDHFVVFGGQASSTYLTGTDGGETGGGRAAKALIYRNTFGPVKISLQAQLNGVRANYCGSVKVKIYKGLEMGAAINDIRISKEAEDYVLNVQDFELTGIIGVKFQNEKLYTAFNFNINGGDILPIHLPDTSLIYGYHFTGYEFYGKYKIIQKLSIHGGFNIQIPTNTNTIIDDHFHMEYYALGVDYNFSPAIQTYIEFKLDNSTNAAGKHSFNVFTLGMNIKFNKVFNG